jgi:hypothetical protein
MNQSSRNEATQAQRENGERPKPERYRIDATYLNRQGQATPETLVYTVGIFGTPRPDSAPKVLDKLNQELRRKGEEYYENKLLGGIKQFVSVQIINQRTKQIISTVTPNL